MKDLTISETDKRTVITGLHGWDAAVNRLNFKLLAICRGAFLDTPLLPNLLMYSELSATVYPFHFIVRFGASHHVFFKRVMLLLTLAFG